METDIEYTKPVAWDLKKGKDVIRTVHFTSRFIEVLGRRYKVCGSDSKDDDGAHLLANVDTNEWRWVNGKVIRVWLDMETEKTT